MTRFCASCGAETPETARFCAACGTPVIPETPISPLLTASERRQATFMFVDLVGSTEMVERLDPEDLIDVRAAYHKAMVAAAERFHGHTARIEGDGVATYFGWPTASEEGAANAVCAALASVEAAKRIDAEFGKRHQVKISVRVGIATGIVVAAPESVGGHGGAIDFIGSAPNLAARLQNLAALNSVVVSASTYRLAGDAFAWSDLGYHSLKGFEEPIHAYGVLGARATETRLELRLGQRRTPMVNREEEMVGLIACWEAATRGEAQVVLVTGDPGIGKSRLIQAFEERLRLDERSHRRVVLQCSATLVNTALHPHIAQLQRAAGFQENDSTEERLTKLRAFLIAEGLEDPLTFALLADLLSISANLPPLAMSPMEQRQRTLGALIDLLLRASKRAPVLLVYEDLHWLDPTSSALVEQAVHSLRECRVLLLATARPGATLSWASVNNVIQIALTRLSPGYTREMVERIVEGTDLPTSAFVGIVERTDGVPLYVEELTHMVLDATASVRGATVGGPALELPETLLDLLTERLDRLGAARSIAQIGAVIGRQFPVALVAAVADRPAEAMRGDFERLLSSGLIQQTPTPDVLSFKHALVQDAAYDSILVRARRDIHARIASIIVTDFPNLAKTEPEGVARHLTNAGKWLEAADWWLRAGQQALRRGAPQEAATHFQTGLSALESCPEDEARVRAELHLLAGLGPALMVMHGPGHPEFGRVQRRAFDTTLRLTDRPALFPITYGLALYHWGRAEPKHADPLAAQLMEIARSNPIPEFVMAANNMTAMIRFHTGAPAEARRLLTESTALYKPNLHAQLYPRYMMDFGVFGRFYLALSSFVIGDPDFAAAKALEAVKLADELNQPHSQGFAMMANFMVAAFRRDPGIALQWADGCIDFAGARGFPEFVALAMIVRGWAVAEEGDAVTGLELVERGIDQWKATGFENWQSWYATLRAEMLLKLGRVTDALRVFDEQQHRIAENDETVFESLLISAHAGALSAAGDDPAHIEALHRKALSLAARQQARSWELRCGLAYASWLRNQVDRTAEASDVLRRCLGFFPDSVITGDIRDARALFSLR